MSDQPTPEDVLPMVITFDFIGNHAQADEWVAWVLDNMPIKFVPDGHGSHPSIDGASVSEAPDGYAIVIQHGTVPPWMEMAEVWQVEDGADDVPIQSTDDGRYAELHAGDEITFGAYRLTPTEEQTP
jgi:hypothetical protein